MGRGRPSVNRTVIDRNIFMEILTEKGTSVLRLAKKLDISDKTIRRGFSSGLNNEIIDRIAAELNVSPAWMTGEAQKSMSKHSFSAKQKEKLARYYDWRNHPYDQLAEQRKKIDISEALETVYQKLGLNMSAYASDVSQQLKDSMKDFVTASIQMVMIYFLREYDLVLDPFLCSDEMMEMAQNVIESEEYDLLWGELVIKPW